MEMFPKQIQQTSVYKLIKKTKRKLQTIIFLEFFSNYLNTVVMKAFIYKVSAICLCFEKNSIRLLSFTSDIFMDDLFFKFIHILKVAFISGS